MGLKVAPMSRSIARRVGGRLPRAVAKLRIDGGTTFVTRSDRQRWHSKLAAVAEWILDPATWEGREKGDGPPLVRLPMPPVPRRHQADIPGVALSLVPDGVLDPRHLGWSLAPPTFEVHYNGGGKFFRLYAHDRIDLRFLRKKDPDTREITWEVHAVVKAREVYADGHEVWMQRWLGWIGWLLHGVWAQSPDDFDGLWNVSSLHINSDLVDLALGGEDKWSFCGWRKSTEHGGHRDVPDEKRPNASDEEEKPPIRRGDPLRELDEKATRYFTDTLYFGKNTSDTEVCIYRKSTQLEDVKKVKPGSSMYAPLWERGGWNGSDRITRVEFRLRKKGLKFCRKKKDGTRELIIDLTKPSALLDESKLRRVWFYVATKRRLVVPKNPDSRLTRSPLDPAWAAVIRLDGPELDVSDIRQEQRKVRENTQRERQAKDLERASAAAIAWATRHGAMAKSYEDVGAILVAMGQRMLAGGAPEEFDALPRVRDVAVRGEYAANTSAFFSGEADALYEDFCAEVGVELERVDWERASGSIALGDEDGFSQSLARGSASGVRSWTRDALTRPTSPTLPHAFRRGALFGLAAGLESSGAPADVLEAFEHFRRHVRFQGEDPPESSKAMPTETDLELIDLGDAKSFPQHLSPNTAQGVRSWMRLALTAEDDTKAREVRVPPAFRRGAILGFKDALEHILPIAKAAGEESLTKSLETMLEFVKLTGVTEGS